MMFVKYLFAKFMKKVMISAIRDSVIDSSARVCSASNIVYTKMGRYSYIGSYCTVVNANIGSFCSIADNCIIGGAAHPMEWVSMSPVFEDGKNILNQHFATHKYRDTQKTNIGNDVWIGNNCLIKEGIKIGDGAVIGMGSVVTKDVLPYSIVAGNPAHLLRMRFDKETILLLQKIKWWDFCESDLKQAANLFNDVNAFIKKYFQ